MNKYLFVTHNLKAGKEAEFRAYLDEWNRNASEDDKRKQIKLEHERGFHSDITIPINDSLIYCVWQVRNDLTSADLKEFLDSDESLYTPVAFMTNTVTLMDTKHPSFVDCGMREHNFLGSTTTERTEGERARADPLAV